MWRATYAVHALDAQRRINGAANENVGIAGLYYVTVMFVFTFNFSAVLSSRTQIDETRTGRMKVVGNKTHFLEERGTRCWNFGLLHSLVDTMTNNYLL